MGKTFFIDIDGTLCNPTGDIRPLTKEAVRKAKENGHQLFICTGRSISEIVPEIIELNFDGIIGAGGAYIEYNHKVLYHQVLENKELKDVIHFFQINNIEYYLECNNGIYGSEHCIPKMLEVGKSLNENPMDSSWFFNLIQPIDYNNLDTLEVNKICFINNVLPLQTVIDKFSKNFDVIPATVIAYGEASGEITSKAINKETAIHFLCQYLHINKRDTVAIGDGGNDIPMFNAVNYGIAMGNAANSLKIIANEICEDVNEDGFYYSFLRNAWIS